jgi:hypothetical protein
VWAEAADVLAEVAEGRVVGPGAEPRLKAARAVLQFGMRCREAVEPAGRVQELERMTALNGEGRGHE